MTEDPQFDAQEPVDFRAISIRFDFGSILSVRGWKSRLNVVWGYDIFLNGVPLLKSLVLANVIVWVVLFLLAP